jgi:hypothetical protein
MERHEVASQAYETAGLQILELAQTAYSSYVAKNPHEQARLIKTLVSNSTFDRGSLSPTYVKPFDVFAKGSETGDWLARLDSNYAALWKSSIWRIQLVSGFHLGQIWATSLHSQPQSAASS